MACLRRLFLPVLFSTAFLASGKQISLLKADEGDHCDAVLVKQNISLKTESSKVHLAWLMLVNESNYEQAKHYAGASLLNLFSGSYNDFVEKRKQYFKMQHYTRSLEEARTEVMANTSEKAIDAWLECKKLVVTVHPSTMSRGSWLPVR